MKGRKIKVFQRIGKGSADEKKKEKCCHKDNAKSKRQTKEDVPVLDELLSDICEGLGGKENISRVECDDTRLLFTVYDATLVNDSRLKLTGAVKILHNGNTVQIIYEFQVMEMKSDFETYLNNETASLKKQRNEAKSQKMQLNSEMKTSERKVRESIIIASPMTGVADEIENTPDNSFSKKIIGDGAVITPSEPIVMAPADGVVSFVFDTKHVIGIRTDSDLDIIVHIGISTEKLKGNGFDLYVKSGQRVKKGDNLMKLNLKYLKSNASSIKSPVICTEIQDNQRVRLLSRGNIHAGEELFAVDIFE